MTDNKIEEVLTIADATLSSTHFKFRRLKICYITLNKSLIA